MTTYDLIVNIPNPDTVALVRDAKYELCLGVFTEAGGTAFSSTAINRISCQYTLGVMSPICFWNIHH